MSQPPANDYWDLEVEHWVYRCFDAADRLLYIGCTGDVEARMQIHRSSWQNPASAHLIMHMKRYETEGPFAGRLAGRAAEKAAIEVESPLLNVHHNGGRGLSRSRVQMTPAQLAAHDAECAAVIDRIFGDVLARFAS